MDFVSTAAQLTIMRSHSVDARATVFHPILGQRTVPFSSGSVTDDATSNVRRTAELTVDPRLWPKDPFDLLSPFGAWCLLEYGIVVPRIGTEWVPMGVFSLDDTSRTRPLSGDAGVMVRLVDFSARVAEHTFDAPTQTVAGATAAAEITRLVLRTFPDIGVINLSGALDRVVPQMEMQADPWVDGVEKLATAIQCEAFFDSLGRLVIRPQPTLNDVPVWYARTGLEGANILSTRESLTRDKVYNRVRASGQRSDSIPAVSAIAQDTDPNSPTRVGGPFGTRTFKYASPLLTTTQQCTDTANALLQRKRGLRFNVDFDLLVHPGLRSGDVTRLDDEDLGSGAHIADKVVTPLGPEGGQQVTTRSDDLPLEQ